MTQLIVKRGPAAKEKENGIGIRIQDWDWLETMAGSSFSSYDDANIHRNCCRYYTNTSVHSRNSREARKKK